MANKMHRILHRLTGKVLFELECASIKLCVEAAVAARANLADADLADANLFGANLARANLARAYLARANLARANLARANLARANLADADLADANLFGAYLFGANLVRANLADADLADANLARADLAGANLRSFRADLYDVLVTARDEAPAFLAALRAGNVDGTVYEGKCACLVGTIANVRGVNYATLPHNSSRPIEAFLTSVKPGDTPETNQVAALVAEWTAAFIGEGVA